MKGYRRAHPWFVALLLVFTIHVGYVNLWVSHSFDSEGQTVDTGGKTTVTTTKKTTTTVGPVGPLGPGGTQQNPDAWKSPLHMQNIEDETNSFSANTISKADARGSAISFFVLGGLFITMITVSAFISCFCKSKIANTEPGSDNVLQRRTMIGNVILIGIGTLGICSAFSVGYAVYQTGMTRPNFTNLNDLAFINPIDAGIISETSWGPLPFKDPRVKVPLGDVHTCEKGIDAIANEIHKTDTMEQLDTFNMCVVWITILILVLNALWMGLRGGETIMKDSYSSVNKDTIGYGESKPVMGFQIARGVAELIAIILMMVALFGSWSVLRRHEHYNGGITLDHDMRDRTETGYVTEFCADVYGKENHLEEGACDVFGRLFAGWNGFDKKNKKLWADSFVKYGHTTAVTTTSTTTLAGNCPPEHTPLLCQDFKDVGLCNDILVPRISEILAGYCSQACDVCTFTPTGAPTLNPTVSGDTPSPTAYPTTAGVVTADPTPAPTVHPDKFFNGLMTPAEILDASCRNWTTYRDASKNHCTKEIRTHRSNFSIISRRAFVWIAAIIYIYLISQWLARLVPPTTRWVNSKEVGADEGENKDGFFHRALSMMPDGTVLLFASTMLAYTLFISQTVQTQCDVFDDSGEFYDFYAPFSASVVAAYVAVVIRVVEDETDISGLSDSVSSMMANML